jgi:hypothetical protein
MPRAARAQDRLVSRLLLAMLFEAARLVLSDPRRFPPDRIMRLANRPVSGLT